MVQPRRRCCFGVVMSDANWQPVIETPPRIRVAPELREVVAEKAVQLDDVDAAFRIEREVFEECGYGQMPVELDVQSTFYIARLASTGEILGVLRMILGTPVPLPFLKLPLRDSWRDVYAAIPGDRLIEYGALAVPQANQEEFGLSVSKALYRAGWEYSIEVDAGYSGMVMEPRRARVLARWHGLVFEQVGDTTFYMGGDVAAFVATPVGLLSDLKRLNPDFAEYVTTRYDPILDVIDLRDSQDA